MTDVSAIGPVYSDHYRQVSLHNRYSLHCMSECVCVCVCVCVCEGVCVCVCVCVRVCGVCG